MNYYPFYASPVASAEALDDKRVRRSFILGVNTLRDMGAPRTQWLIGSGDTQLWFTRWVIALGDEIMHRFDKRYQAHDLLDTLKLDSGALPQPCTIANAAKSCAKATRPADFTYLPVHEAYQRYAIYRWGHIDKRAPTWTRRERPAFAAS